MGIDFYTSPVSGFCRAVQLTAANLGLELNIKNVDLLAGEHMNPEYLKINPCHQIPAIDDNGFLLAESRAIMQYLANAYSKDDTASLYPKLTKKRAIVDQRLCFDLAGLFKSFADAYYPAIFQGGSIDEDKLPKLDENLGIIENILKETKYFAGEELTIADFGIIASLTTIKATGHSFEQFPTILGYLERCKEEVKGYDENELGANMFGEFAKSKIAKE